MKTSLAALLLFLGHASAGGPELSLTVKDGTSGGLTSAITPKLAYKGSHSGVNVGASIDHDLSKTAFVEKKLDISGWNLRTHAEYSEGIYPYDSEGQRGVYLTVEAKNEDENTFAWASGDVSLSPNAELLKLGAKRVFNMDSGIKLMVEPRYNFEKEGGPDVVLGVEKVHDDESDTRVYLTASQKDQNLMIQHSRDATTASIKAGISNGFMRASLKQDFENIGSLKATLTSKDVDLELSQDGWKAGVNVDLEGLSLESEPTVRFSKTLSFSA
jgi:hypothetical protein